MKTAESGPAYFPLPLMCLRLVPSALWKMLAGNSYARLLQGLQRMPEKAYPVPAPSLRAAGQNRDGLLSHICLSSCTRKQASIALFFTEIPARGQMYNPTSTLGDD